MDTVPGTPAPPKADAWESRAFRRGRNPSGPPLIPTRQFSQYLETPLAPAPAGPSSVFIDIRGGLGDVLMVAGVARALRQAWPETRVGYRCPPQQIELLGENPDVVWSEGPLDPNALMVHYPESFAGVWSEQDSPQWHWMRALCRAVGVSWDPASLRRRYYMTAEESSAALPLLESYPRPWLALHPYSSGHTQNKCYDRWGEVLPHLPGTTFVFGAHDPHRRRWPSAVSLEDQHGLRQSLALLSHMDLALTGDSMLMHAAEAVGVPHVVTLWGATCPQITGLFTEGAINLEPRQRACEAGGPRCWSYAKQCRAGSKCINSIPPADVLAAVAEALDLAPRLATEFLIVNWNSASYTVPLLRQLRDCAKTNCRVVVVDNGSRPEDVHQVRAALEQHWPRAHQLIASPQNLGFPAGVNRGLEECRAEVVVLLNPDLELQDPGFDERIHWYFQRYPRAGIIGCGGNEGAFYFGPHQDLCCTQGLQRCDRVNGACMAIHRRCLNKVPWLDELFTPGLCEETDYCVRAQALGLEVWWFPAKIRHLCQRVTRGNGFSWKTSGTAARNVALFDRRWRRFQMPLSGNMPKAY